MDFNARGFAHTFRTPRTPHRFAQQTQHQWPRPPVFLSESLLLPSSQQPPPMFGPRGATIPPRLFKPRRDSPGMNDHYFNKCDDNYWCETCDRGFKTESLLNHHKNEHQRCNIDGCSFIAHPKVITKHIQMQHSSGLYNKISKLNDPEEIKKWREERRKHFPTKANIEQKRAEVQEKIERGEKMGLRKRKFPENIHSQKNNFKGPRNIKRRPKRTEKSCPATKLKHKLPSFTGIKELIAECEPNEELENYACNENFIIDDEFEDSVETKAVMNNVCGAIHQLIVDYKSSSEEDNDHNGTTKKSIENCKKSDLESKQSNLLKSAESVSKDVSKTKITFPKTSECHEDDSGPEEIETVKTKEEIPINLNNMNINVINTETSSKSENSSKNPSGKIIKRRPNIKNKLYSTLLQKLLASEIKHERNVTLQCIRFIVTNNFFEK